MQVYHLYDLALEVTQHHFCISSATALGQSKLPSLVHDQREGELNSTFCGEERQILKKHGGPEILLWAS